MSTKDVRLTQMDSLTLAHGYIVLSKSRPSKFTKVLAHSSRKRANQITTSTSSSSKQCRRSIRQVIQYSKRRCKYQTMNLVNRIYQMILGQAVLITRQVSDCECSRYQISLKTSVQQIQEDRTAIAILSFYHSESVFLRRKIASHQMAKQRNFISKKLLNNLSQKITLKVVGHLPR